MSDEKIPVEKAFLIGVQEPDMTLSDALEHLAELGELLRCLNIAQAGKCMTLLRESHARYLLGSGKAEEIIEQAKISGADCLIFDCELSPSQQRNWEHLSKMPVADRQEIILDIFAKRAWTREAVLQIELARLQYALPRLTRAWTHLSRQRGGGTGARGDGEKQIELDRRMVLQKIQQLRKDLLDIRSQRDTQRKNRSRNLIPHAAIVGYTNAGKSSLINAITGASVFVQDQLFATLDPTTRKYTFSNGKEMLLTDTVGFVRRLPHLLVESFKSTLEEAALADFLIVVLDASSHQVDEHFQTTLRVLEELGAKEKQLMICFNKIDLQQDPIVLARLRATHPQALFFSAKTGENLDVLIELLLSRLTDHYQLLTLKLSPTQGAILAQAHTHAIVESIDYDEHGNTLLTIRVSEANAPRFNPYITLF